jgi:hypothetical protein
MKMTEQTTLTVITLKDLEDLWAKWLYEQTGTPQKAEYPQELTPAWIPYCKSHWGAYESMLEKREKQLKMMGMDKTHQIDWYANRKPVRPL